MNSFALPKIILNKCYSKSIFNKRIYSFIYFTYYEQDMTNVVNIK